MLCDGGGSISPDRREGPCALAVPLSAAGLSACLIVAALLAGACGGGGDAPTERQEDADNSAAAELTKQLEDPQPDQTATGGQEDADNSAAAEAIEQLEDPQIDQTATDLDQQKATRQQETSASTTFKTVSAGDLHSCGLRTDDTIECWGGDRWRLSDALSGTFKAISVVGHSCGLRTDDTIECWGPDYSGRSSIDVPSGTFIAISTDYSHSCGLRTDDTIECWGDNRWGRADARSHLQSHLNKR